MSLQDAACLGWILPIGGLAGLCFVFWALLDED